MKDHPSRLLTVPNLLTLFRLCLIPPIIWLYAVRDNGGATFAVILLSALSDIADGYIARRYHMVSNLGKALDPIADKLTLLTLTALLLGRFPSMLVLLLVFVCKEVSMGVMGLWVIRKTGVTYSADWHGKVATALLYAAMLAHVLWDSLPPTLSAVWLSLCIAAMVLSFVLYTVANTRRLTQSLS
ncbi:MAG: CDP-alcohol phosphatidyltransferase family protein [Eubacteriales bacterium]